MREFKVFKRGKFTVLDFINKFLNLICDTSKKIEEVSISRMEYNNDMKKIRMDWINRFKKIGHIEEITRSIAAEFLSNIYIYEDKNIEIQFRYKDQFEDLAKYLKK